MRDADALDIDHAEVADIVRTGLALIGGLRARLAEFGIEPPEPGGAEAQSRYIAWLSGEAIRLTGILSATERTVASHARRDS